MTYKLFLDDERFPIDDSGIVRSYAAFCDTILVCGVPEFISFDHDLGEEKTGLDCAKFLVKLDMDGIINLKGLKFYVHSQNPIGKVNIETYLQSYLCTKN